MECSRDQACLERVQRHMVDTLSEKSRQVLPSPSTLLHSNASLLRNIPEQGLGVDKTTVHVLQDISPALNGSSLSPNYYGFVSGGMTPAARIAENIVCTYDQNPQVHLPDQTVASTLEDQALKLLMELLRFDPRAWSGVFTTGATASNILGLAIGREYTINEAIKRKSGPGEEYSTVGSEGLLRACHIAGISDFKAYTTMPHSSLLKAASVVGMGRSNVRNVAAENGISFNMEEIEAVLEKKSSDSAIIVVLSCGEVNTGFFATHGYEELNSLRALCDKHNAWLHVDGAFGLFARVLDGSPGFEYVAKGAEGLELADSIAGDAHKLLNVPYDCGFFFCRHPGISQQVFQNPNAAYLNTKNAATDTVQSPLNVGIENSRRFRGLPVYASIIAYGRNGYNDMILRQIRFARAVAKHLFDHEAFELLPKSLGECRERIDQEVFIIVLFRANDIKLNENLVRSINGSSAMYISGTQWEGRPASRIAVSNWQVDPHRDLKIVQGVLESVVREWTIGRTASTN